MIGGKCGWFGLPNPTAQSNKRGPTMMTKAKMNAALKKAGCTKIKEFWENVKKDGTNHWKEVDYPHDSLHVAFEWTSTPEGGPYWGGIYSTLNRLQILAKKGVATPDYSVRKHGRNLCVGCQTLTPKHQKNLFRLLAEQLGYDVED